MIEQKVEKQIPSKWATVEAAWGESNRHLYSADHESFQFHKTEKEARAAAEKEIREGTVMVALLEVKTLYVAKPVEFDQIDG